MKKLHLGRAHVRLLCLAAGLILFTSAKRLEGQSCVPTVPSLKSWWTFQVDANDTAGLNHGIVRGGATFGPGRVGNGMVFDGIDDGVRIPASSSLDVSAGEGFTVELWANPADASVIQPLVEWNNAGAVGVYLWIGASGNRTLNAKLIEPNGVEHSLNGPAGTVASGVWQHLALTYSRADGLGTLYHNGSVVLQQNLGALTPRTSSDLFFGERGGFHFRGMMDEASIYARALDATEIQSIVQAGAAGKCALGTGITIVQQPRDLMVTEGGTATFSVAAQAATPIQYQWLHEGQPLSGATDQTLVLNNVRTNQAGAYSVSLRNSVGSITSDVARLVVVVGPVVCAPLPPSIRAWWPLEADAQEIIGGNTGSVTGGSFAPGWVGNGMAFDGVDDGVRISGSTSLDVGAGEGFTIELWAKPTDASVIQPLLEWNHNGAVGLYLWLSASGPGTLDANLIEANGVEHPMNPSTGTVRSGVWQHFALTYSRTEGRSVLYQDGTIVLQRTLGAFTPQTSSDLFFGVRGSFHFKGVMDEISVYSRALTEAEIRSIASAGTAGKCGPTAEPLIIEQPADAAVKEGATATFRVRALGAPPLQYQWLHGEELLPGATDATLVLRDVQASLAGDYSVIVRNPVGVVTSATARLVISAPSFDIEADFSADVNPGPDWSYGWKSSLSGTFTAFAHRITGVANNGVQFIGWAREPGNYPIVFHNPTSETAVTGGGGVYPPKATWFHPGFENTPYNFGVIRLTLPSGIAGTYRLDTAATAHINGVDSGDCDYHIVHNGIELFGQFLFPRTGTSFGTNLFLRSGDTVDFLIGRGADGILFGSGLKLKGTLTLIPNEAPVAHVSIAPLLRLLPDQESNWILAANNRDALVTLDASLSTDADDDPLEYVWMENGELLAMGVSMTTTFDLGAHSITLLLNDGKTTTTTTVVFAVITGAEFVDELIELLSSSSAESQRKRPLMATLKAVGAALDRGQTKTAANLLSAFQYKVRAQLLGSDPGLAGALDTGAGQLIQSFHGE